MAKLIDDDDDDPLEFNEDVERSWRAYLKHFYTDVFPMFEERGLTLGEALMVWEMNRMKNAICRMADDKDGT